MERSWCNSGFVTQKAANASWESALAAATRLANQLRVAEFESLWSQRGKTVVPLDRFFSPYNQQHLKNSVAGRKPKITNSVALSI